MHKAKLAKWALKAMLSLSADRDHEPLVNTIDQVAYEQGPLFAHDETLQKTVALIIAVNFREGSLIPSIKGDKDKKGNYTSFCSMQINLPGGSKTIQGWTGEDLSADPYKCLTVGWQMLRTSVRMCPKHPVAFYAEGKDVSSCASIRAQKISNDRMYVAQSLVKKVEWPEEDASDQPYIRTIPAKVYTPRMFWDNPH